MIESLLVQTGEYGLLTDLYQLTMAACYVGEGMEQRRASFELFVRRLPEDFGYLIVAGLEQALYYLQQFSFTPTQVDWLRDSGQFDRAPDAFWPLLETARFSGDLWALPEGTAVGVNTPLLRVEAPLWQAQIVETYLLNTLNYQTLIATRAARMRDIVGPEAVLLEFGTRRAFSPQGAMWAARAAIAGGMNTTSNVLAAYKLGRQPAGTMAHALVMAFTASDSEDAAFAAFQRYFPDSALLIDTYDTVAAAQRLAQRMAAGGPPVAAVRIDSGDLGALAAAVRSHLPRARIIVSGDLDEAALLQLRQAPVSGYGVGTRLVTGSPVNGVYKLVEIDGTPTMKISSHKATYPGRKQLFRHHGADGIHDRLGLMGEMSKSGEQPLLQLTLQEGERIVEPESLETIAQRTAASVASLPAAVRQPISPQILTPTISAQLEALTATTRQQLQL